MILLVEDNPRDEALTIRTLRKSNVANKIIVARDGVKALDYLFGTGARFEVMKDSWRHCQKPYQRRADVGLPFG